MNQKLINDVCRLTGATSVTQGKVLQSLWSGYGDIVRVFLSGAGLGSLVLKRIRAKAMGQHPRGWNTDVGHQRKLKSYQVEIHWYQEWSALCSPACRVPRCYGVLDYPDEYIIVLEDLDASGFDQRKTALNLAEVHACLRWLAHFHARFLNQNPQQLWPVGTYWHLATRPDELAAMAPGELKDAAVRLDQVLNNAQYQTLVHGDAKVANFCFRDDVPAVAAVDFQYVGGGCGMKDVAYLLGSCLDESECQRYESSLLDVYFSTLTQSVAQLNVAVDSVALEHEWRRLFPMAWADFHRFILGWMPEHKKNNAYSECITRRALQDLAVY